MQVDNKMLLPQSEVLDASPGPLVLVSSEQDNQFTEVVKNKRKERLQKSLLFLMGEEVEITCWIILTSCVRTPNLRLNHDDASHS